MFFDNKINDIYPKVINQNNAGNFPQVDGNDSIEEDDDFDIAGLTEAEIYERDPALLYTGYTFEDVETTSVKQPSSSTKTATFSLNKDKQINALGADTNLSNFAVTVNDDDKNVIVQCNTAFYDAVAKPVMCGLTKGATLNINNISISCTHIDHNRDSKCFEYNRVLHVKLGGSGQFSIGKVTIHLHHSKRSVQMQGSALMPDGTRSPVWFLNSFVKERFLRLARLKHFDITAINDAVRRTVEKHRVSDNIGSNCSQCLRLYASNAKPTQCIYCFKYFHKTGCLPAHSSSCHSKYVRPACPPSASVIFQTRTSISSPSTPEGSPGSSSSPAPSSKRPRADSSGTSSLSTSTLATVDNFAPQRPAEPPVSSNQANASTPSLPVTGSLPLAIAANIPTASASVLNVNATPFNFAPNPPPNPPPKRKQKTKSPLISPEAAKVDFLNLELNAAKTRIVQLETSIDDNEGTIKIQKEKIKILEESHFNSASSKYNVNNPQGPTNVANDQTFSSTRRATHLKLPECCPSSVLQCHHCTHRCHPCAHCCHQLQQSPQQVRQPSSDASGAALLDQVSILNEIKRELRSIHEGINSIASNASPKNVPKDNDKARMAPSTELQPNQLSEMVESNKNPVNDAKENPEYIDVVSVEIVSVLDSDDSVASADDFVPEIPSRGQASLN